MGLAIMVLLYATSLEATSSPDTFYNFKQTTAPITVGQVNKIMGNFGTLDTIHSLDTLYTTLAFNQEQHQIHCRTISSAQKEVQDTA